MKSDVDTFTAANLVAQERHWRDRGQWDLMASAYEPDCEIRLAWFVGTTDAFVKASRSGGRGGVTKHRLSPSIVDVNGDRAVAETSAVVETRTAQDGIEVDLFVHCRYVNRLRRRGGSWRLASVDCICEKDTLLAVHPDEPLKFDRSLLATYRSSYRFLSYNLQSHGISPPSDLPGDDRPELCEPIYSAAERWLRG
jgi:hypothetical protein